MTQSFLTRLTRPFLLLLVLGMAACTTYSGPITGTAASETRQIETANGETFSVTVEALTRHVTIVSSIDPSEREPFDAYVTRITITDANGQDRVVFVPQGEITASGQFSNTRKAGFRNPEKAIKAGWDFVNKEFSGVPFSFVEPPIDAHLDAIDTVTN
jgi:hypothetical protein